MNEIFMTQYIDIVFISLLNFTLTKSFGVKLDGYHI